MQQKTEQLKQQIRNENERKEESDPLVIANGADEIEKLSVKIKSLSAKLETVPKIVQTIVMQPNEPSVFEFNFGSLEPNCKCVAKKWNKRRMIC